MDIVRTFLLVTFACFVQHGGACVVGNFDQSVNGRCPDGMFVVNDFSSCKSIKQLGAGLPVTFYTRTPACTQITSLPFGCYKDGNRLRFNPLDKEYTCANGQVIVRVGLPNPLIPSVCECKPTTTALTIASATSVMASSRTRPTTSTSAVSVTTATRQKLEVTVASSSRCPQGTAVVTDHAQCEQLVPFSIPGDAKYAGEIGPVHQDKRPHGCFIDNNKIPTEECKNVKCVHFNEGDYDISTETTEFLAVCVPAPSTSSTTTTSTSTTTMTTTTSTTTTSTIMSSSSSTMPGYGAVQNTPFLTDSTQPIPHCPTLTLPPSLTPSHPPSH